MSAPSDGAGPAASSSDAGAADGSGAAGAASGSSDAEMVMRGGQMKKAFAPNLAAAGRKAKGKVRRAQAQVSFEWHRVPTLLPLVLGSGIDLAL